MKLTYLVIFSFLLCGTGGCFTVRSTKGFSYSKLSPVEYAAVLKDSSNYYLIDVRTAAEYNRSRMAGSVSYSYFNFHIGRDVDTLDRNKPVLVYCQTCHRSPLAARKMKKMGFRKIYDLKGGYKKWMASRSGL